MFLKKYALYFIIPLTLLLTFTVGYCVGLLTDKANTPILVETIVNDEPSTTEIVTGDDITVTEKIDLGEFKLTAYCICPECCGEYSDGITSTGARATPGRTIAVDPEVIPYGTVVEINGNEFIAEDCGEAIKGNHIDVLCASHELAECFGVQYANVYAINAD